MRTAERFATVLLFGWMAASLAVLSISVVRSYSLLPAMDYWETIAHLDAYRRFPPVVFWQQHYEHRILIPELFFAFDWLFLRGREILPLLLNAVLHLGIWLLYALVFRGQLAGRNKAFACALFLAGIVMFWPGMAVVLAFPFLLQWTLCQFCATASFAAMAYQRVPLAITLALAAMFSSANGLFVWPILILIGLAIPLPRRKIAELSIAAVLATFLFFLGYRNLGNSHPKFIWQYPAKFFGYLLTYLGMPLGAVGMWTALAAGTGSIVLVLALTYFSWRRQMLRQPPVLILGGVVLITFATAFITSCSRIPVDRRFADAIVTPGRYVDTSVQYWAVLILLTFMVANAKSHRGGWLVIACSTGLLALTLSQSGEWIHLWMNSYAIYQTANLAVESRVDLKTAGEMLNYADGTLVTRSLPELEARHLALFSFPEYQSLGKPFIRAAGTVAGTVKEIPVSAITSVEPVPGGYRLIGWSELRPRRLEITDRSGTIIGFGAHLGAGLPIGAPLPAGHEKDEFLAYAGPAFRREEAHLLVRR